MIWIRIDFWISWIRIRFGNADPDTIAGKFTKINKK
jgi:hypothetical protein